MAAIESLTSVLTVTDLAELFGGIPAWRIRNAPAPGTATESDVIAIQEREGRLCELVEGVLVEKTVGYGLVCRSAPAHRGGFHRQKVIEGIARARKLDGRTGLAGLLRAAERVVRRTRGTIS